MFRAKTVFIAAISSDIGRQLAEIYSDKGYQVVGTFRNLEHVKPLVGKDYIHLIECDLNSAADIAAVGGYLEKHQLEWDIFISAVGLLSPIGKFSEISIGDWVHSVSVNSLQQLELFHQICPYKKQGEIGRAAFLVGGAINRAFANYSAYSLGKVMLVKFCELFSDENPDFHCVAIGTGWVASKIHQQTIEAGENAGENFGVTKEFMQTEQQGTPIIDIFEIIDWCFEN
ncbi:SDR family NAD(P)-dependent oxidoreductase [Sneathiella glossodoripedis]|uniref:SDR family NAD(P)-dependent oxidoreductase n=1 Tax=Sneathiella glossodoripedis TaxID=418853 RepID=UPI000685F0CE|nr:SDR family NAD(P)-dependent oxidoreductase [Sneathiella glossodoripedis]